MFAVEELKRSGFNIWLEGKKIRYRQVNEKPIDRVWLDNLLAEIKAHKPEAINYLSGPTDQGQQPEIVVDPGDQIESEPTHDFEIVELYSDLVNEKFYVCRTPELRNLAKENDPGVVAYLPGEIESLKGLQPEEVKKLHHAKKLFGGNLSRSPQWETLK